MVVLTRMTHLNIFFSNNEQRGDAVDCGKIEFDFSEADRAI